MKQDSEIDELLKELAELLDQQVWLRVWWVPSDFLRRLAHRLQQQNQQLEHLQDGAALVAIAKLGSVYVEQQHLGAFLPSKDQWAPSAN